jgi:hypothetical protein
MKGTSSERLLRSRTIDIIKINFNWDGVIMCVEFHTCPLLYQFVEYLQVIDTLIEKIFSRGESDWLVTSCAYVTVSYYYYYYYYYY